MQELQITACYFPTTVLLIDDNKKFLTNVSSLLETKTASYKLFSDPVTALNYLENDYQFLPFTERCLSKPEESRRDHRNIEIDVRAIHEELYNPERFQQISVMVVDYAMPSMDGLTLCQKVKNRFIKKILLTGEADEKLAIEAFNKGLIQKFIRKDALNFEKVLMDAIEELQKEYFYDLSEIIISSITKHPEHPTCCLDDPVFINFFIALCKKHQFTEHYLMDANGSFMFLDIKGNPSWLVVKDDGEMRGWHEIAELADTDVSPSILEPLKNREKILYLHSEGDFTKDPSEWQNYLHPASKLEGRTTYYYSFIGKSKTYDINPGNILTYRAYLDKL